MTQRHPIQADETMFITTNIRSREPIFSNAAFAREAVETLYRVQKLHPFLLYGFVIMPDHCHFLLYIPDSGNVSKIMRSYKRGVTFNVGIGPLWQSRFHIRIPGSLSSVLHYIHMNPVKAGLANEPENYPWSSASGKWAVTPCDPF